MNILFRRMLYALFLVAPLLLARFVFFWSHVMRWQIGSPALPGYNWVRWSHVYLILGCLFCLALYIPVIMAIRMKSSRLLAASAALVVFLFIGSIVLAGIGRNVYFAQESKHPDEAFRPSSKDSMALERMAGDLLEKGEYSRAIELFNKVLETSPDPGFVVHDRGSAYAGARLYELAIADYTKAMDMKPGQKDFVAQCYNDRGVAYFESGKYQESAEDVRRAVKMGYAVHPDFLLALQEKGFKVTGSFYR